MHKIVNGKRIELTEEEKKEMQDMWDENERKMKKKKQLHNEKIQKKEALREKLSLVLGIDSSDVDLLLNN